MSICVCCGEYYKRTSFVGREFCPDCDGITDNYDILDEEINLEISSLLSPSGRVKPKIYDDHDDDSHGL